jgi:hypothetical protein
VGDARRRKILGTYPEPTADKPMRIDTQPTARALECAKCSQTGGTLQYTPEGLVHVPSCEFASAVRMRKERERAEMKRRWDEVWRRKHGLPKIATEPDEGQK